MSGGVLSWNIVLGGLYVEKETMNVGMQVRRGGGGDLWESYLDGSGFVRGVRSNVTKLKRSRKV